MNKWYVIQWMLNGTLWWWVLLGIWPWQYIGKPKIHKVCDWYIQERVDDFLLTDGMKQMIIDHSIYPQMQPGDLVFLEVKNTRKRSGGRGGLFVLDADRKPFTLRLTIQITMRGVRNKLLTMNDMYSPEYVNELVTTRG